MTVSPGILAGVKVVEFAQNAAVPYCGRLLAGMGADVVKVEPPAGDAMRFLSRIAGTDSRGYAAINPGKRSFCLDLGADGARPVVDALLSWADIALMSFKQRDLERYGLDWERVHALNPGLVMMVLSAFGPEGPDAELGGYDVLVQAMSGLGFTMNRSAKGAPLTTRPAMFDFASGMMATAGAIAALRHRELTGLGQRVDTSLLGTAIGIGTALLQRFDDLDGDAVEEFLDDLTLLRSSGADFDQQRAFYEARMMAGAGAFSLYFRPYLTADGIVSIGGLSPALMAKFHELTGVDAPPDLNTESPTFQTVMASAEAIFASKTSNEWLTIFRDGGYPCTRYNVPHEAVLNEQVRANGYTVDLDHPTFGAHTVTGMPVQFSATPTRITGPAPRLGEHTEEVLDALGFGAGAISTLADQGVVALGPNTEESPG